MRILVLGAGQGGTCLLVEAVRGLDLVEFSRFVEDRMFFSYKTLPENYGTKLTTDSIGGIDIDNFSNFPKAVLQRIGKYPDLHIVFSLRHPVDIFMSQIVRGQKPSRGGNGTAEKSSETGSPKGSLLAIAHFFNVYENIIKNFSDRTLSIRMEDLVMKPRRTVRKIARHFGVKPTKRAYEFYKYNRNFFQQERYGGRLDKSVVAIHQKWQTWNGGFFKHRKLMLSVAKDLLADVIAKLGYES